MNNALWSPRGARAGERTRTAGGTCIKSCDSCPKQTILYPLLPVSLSDTKKLNYNP